MLSKIAWVVGMLGLVAIVIAIAGGLPLQLQPGSPDPKPGNVPDDAVAVPYVAQSQLWAKCWVERTDTHCRIFNGAGEVLEDDIFITYARQASVASADLAIVPELSGAEHVWLKTGDILLPQTNYQEHRRNVEKIVRARQK